MHWNWDWKYTTHVFFQWNPWTILNPIIVHMFYPCAFLGSQPINLQFQESTYTTNSNQLSSNLTCKFCWTPISSKLPPPLANRKSGCVGHRVSCIVGFMAHPIVLWMALRYRRCLGLGGLLPKPYSSGGVSVDMSCDIHDITFIYYIYIYDILYRLYIYILGGFNDFFLEFSPPNPWGNDPIWRAYFSHGLKTPTMIKECDKNSIYFNEENPIHPSLSTV